MKQAGQQDRRTACKYSASDGEGVGVREGGQKRTTDHEVCW